MARTDAVGQQPRHLGGRPDCRRLRSTQQTFFTWLGVVPYLTEQPVFSTLGFIASLPGGAHVVFDYSNPPALGPQPRRIRRRSRDPCRARRRRGRAFREPF